MRHSKSEDRGSEPWNRRLVLDSARFRRKAKASQGVTWATNRFCLDVLRCSGDSMTAWQARLGGGFFGRRRSLWLLPAPRLVAALGNPTQVRRLQTLRFGNQTATQRHSSTPKASTRPTPESWLSLRQMHHVVTGMRDTRFRIVAMEVRARSLVARKSAKKGRPRVAGGMGPPRTANLRVALIRCFSSATVPMTAPRAKCAVAMP